MGMDLIRRRDSRKWTCNNSLWRFILNSAFVSGWKPIGPKFSSDIEIEYNYDDLEKYCINDGQTVSPEDAKNMHDNLQTYVKNNKLKKLEKEIIESFLAWIKIQDKKNSYIYPGFTIN